MDLYFSPLACSLATRIALYEAGAAANYLEVDPKTKMIQNDGADFRAINPLGLVPTLRTDDGVILTENAAILQYVADRFPQAGIALGPRHGPQPAAPMALLHRHRTAQGTVRADARQEGAAGGEDLHARQGPVAARLSRWLPWGREFLLDHFSVADAYLVTIINWTMATPPIELKKWPNVKAYYERLRARPSIAGRSPRSSRCTRPNSRATRRRRKAARLAGMP